MKLTKILNNSTFPETTKPYKVFVSEEFGIVAIANSLNTQWSALDIYFENNSNSLLVYSLETLKLINKLENIEFSINDVAFHPSGKTIMIGIGNLNENKAFDKPLSIDAINGKIIIGLVNGKILEYE